VTPSNFTSFSQSILFPSKLKVDILEKESLNLIHWFSHNQMKANPDKFQAIAIGSKTLNESIHRNAKQLDNN
jgi:hypothetical protein